MPKEMDTAFFDRIHAYLPGWELGKTRDGITPTTLASCRTTREICATSSGKGSYVDLPSGTSRSVLAVGGRDAKAVRKTVSGLVKLLHLMARLASRSWSE